MEMKSFVRANLDRVVAVGLAVVGVVAIVIGWIGVSGTGLAPEQIPYVVSGGIGGLVLVAIGCTAWLSADLQDEWRRLDAIEEHLQHLDASLVAPDAETASADGSGRTTRRRRTPVAAEAGA